MTDVSTRLAKRLKRQVRGKTRQSFAVTLPGFEKITAAELSSLPLSDPSLTIEHGGISLNTKLADLMQANLHLRTANRLLMRIGQFKAENFAALEKRLQHIPWELFFCRNHNVQIKASCQRSRLYHRHAIAQRVSQSIARRRELMLPGPDKRFDQAVYVRVHNNRLTFSLDSSGKPLYKRGLKGHSGPAPLRETMAAAVLQLAQYNPLKPLIDPMCGAGSFSLEAAMMLKNMPAGLHRQFALESWPAFQPKQLDYFRQIAHDNLIHVTTPTIHASDSNMNAVNALLRSVQDHHLSDALTVQKKNFFDIDPSRLTSERGLVVLNPPYGIRLGQPHRRDSFYSELVGKLKDCYRGWCVALLIPPNALKRIRPLRLKSLQLNHGGLTVYLCHGRLS